MQAVRRVGGTWHGHRLILFGFLSQSPEDEAVAVACSVAYAGPGCGKSFTVKSVITLAAAKRAKIVLAAPTGRAAKRLTELSGHPATTVHRLLQLRPGGDPSFERDHPLDADVIVVDEASMLDLILANKLIKAVPPGAHLLLVGDVDQLPSVGAGEVLRDVLAADTIPSITDGRSRWSLLRQWPAPGSPRPPWRTTTRRARCRRPDGAASRRPGRQWPQS
jgi:hypothetical protein